jgi:FAD:protein FMN transferase
VSNTAPAATDLPAPTAPRRTRRRVLGLLAVAGGLGGLAWQSSRERQAQRWHWQGLALGAPASITLFHRDRAAAQAAVQAVVAELQRLEALFSLYRADSTLSVLNREGVVRHAASEFIDLMQRALAMAAASDGLFDPTVQPLWRAYFDHFVARGASGAPDGEATARARALIDWRAVHIDGRDVRLTRAGMAVTLNGMAQGYITDRCADLLRARGFTQTLVDMGEPRALAAKPDGSGWTVGIADPRAPERAAHRITVVEQAVATSGGYGTRFDAAGRFTHLIDPRSGRTAPAAQSVTVLAPEAALADALSTTLALLPAAAAGARAALLAQHTGCRAICLDAQGRVSELG